MKFGAIPGHDATKNSLLQAAANEKVPHAQLYAGMEGSAAFPIAMAMAGYMLCENKNQYDRCGNCASCSKFDKHIHPDVHYFFPAPGKGRQKDSENEKREHSLRESWRSFLLQQYYPTMQKWIHHLDEESGQFGLTVKDSDNILSNAFLKPYEAPIKVFIIWLPETMNVQAANRLLKVIEEPPAKTFFFFISENIDQLLVTILSRTQIIRIRPYTTWEAAQALMAVKGCEEELARSIALKSGGNIALALQMLGNAETSHLEEFRAWMLLCASRKFGDLVSRSDAFAEMGKEAQKEFLSYGLQIARQVMLCLAGSNDLLNQSLTDKTFIEKFSARFTMKKTEEFMNIFNQYLGYLERNANPRMTFMSSSLKIMGLISG